MLKLRNGLGELILVCRKCTRESRYPAPSMEAATNLAIVHGWVMEGPHYVCPRCPSGARIARHQLEAA